MGIQILSVNTADDFDRKKRNQVKRRFITIFFILVGVVLLRVVIPKPKPPKAPDHSDAPIQITPGMLDALPLSARAQLSPDIIAQMVKADEDARLAHEIELASKQPEKTEPIIVAS